ncbi:MAG TPA: bifunctional homocysteine S-methyltransferase/methylenetetrahydrofolate reductase [Clostridiales bacterium]|nr:bifunctional homocysteine S-methyltransferase/methylenetetrahydrofolate reductase [Clostridiales bacterium]
MRLKDYLKKYRLIPDGSMGTYYSELVGKPGAISEYANQSEPDIIKQIHKEYLEAGARLLRTNTFAANRAVLQLGEEQQKSLLSQACYIAKSALEEAGLTPEDRAASWILGDIGPIPEDAGTNEEDILTEYKLMCDIFIQEGLEGIHFETFSSLHYIEKLLPYIKNKKSDMFILVSFSVNKNGYTEAGISAARLLDTAGQTGGIDACGLNCGVGSGHLYHILKKLKFPEDRYIYAAPNAGYPEQMQNRMVFMDNAEYFSDNMELVAGLGVDMIGGCCGTTPAYIKALNLRIKNKERIYPRKTEAAKTESQSRPHKENDFYQLLLSGKKVIAVELDPPYDADIDRVMECAHILKSSGADLITFADSPMGRSRVDSILMSIKIAGETGLKVMPHICCRDRNMISIRSSLLGAYIHGIRNLLIVTGDPVPSTSRAKTTAVFDYNSVQLMDFVKEMNLEHFASEPLYFGGALNHGRGNLDREIERMQKKIAAGAAYFLTQPIYSVEDVERIKKIKERVDTKILCGIMPLVSYRNACFIKNEVTGIRVPEEIVDRYSPDMSKEEAENVGVEIAREMMELLDPVTDGYYFMLPFNRVSLMDKILKK